MPCRALHYGDGYLRGMLDFVDCQAQTLGAQGYQALAAPGSAVSLLLTILLTLFVAIQGYRMLLGQTPTVREGVLAVAKIGIVLALATSWPAFRTLFYDTVLHAPAELAASIGQPAGLPGAEGGLVDRLENVDFSLVALDNLGIGSVEGDPPRGAMADGAAPPEAIGRSARRFDPTALGLARTVFLSATIASFAAVRLVAGLLLGLGPLFIAFLLFDATRGIFVAWLRGLLAAVLGATGTAIVLGLELALIEPWLSDLLDRRSTQFSIAGAPIELMVTFVVFSAVLLATLIATSRLAAGLALRSTLGRVSERLLRGFQIQDRTLPRREGNAAIPLEQRTRAATVADAVAAAQRREIQRTEIAGISPERPSRGADRRETVALSAVPGQLAARRTRRRMSASGGKRDRRQ